MAAITKKPRPAGLGALLPKSALAQFMSARFLPPFFVRLRKSEQCSGVHTPLEPEPRSPGAQRGPGAQRERRPGPSPQRGMSAPTHPLLET